MDTIDIVVLTLCVTALGLVIVFGSRGCAAEDMEDRMQEEAIIRGTGAWVLEETDGDRVFKWFTAEDIRHDD